MKTSGAQQNRCPLAGVLPMCQGESVTYVSEHSSPSRNPYCTAVFCAVPRKRIFSMNVSSARGRVASKQLLRHRQLVDFSTQVPDLTLFNPFYPRHLSRSPIKHSTFFHQKSPAIPHIPLNSTYDVPPDRNHKSDIKNESTFPTQVPDFIAFHHLYLRVGAPFPSSLAPWGVFQHNAPMLDIRLVRENADRVRE